MGDEAVLADLKTAKANIAKRLAEITASPKPSYSEAGRRFSWGDYQRFLLDSLAKLDEQIERYEGPQEESTFGLI